MAAYYFDNTSPIETAGFGTLNGNWTDFKWTLSSGGTTTPGIAWPGAGNEATFGGLSNTAVGGTLTAAGTVNLDAITVQRLTTTTTQILTGGTLSFGSVTAPISVASGLFLTISSAIAGTAGFTKAGTGLLSITNASGTNTITTAGSTSISVTGAAGFTGAMTLGAAGADVNIANVFPGTGGSVPKINVAAANDWVRAYSTASPGTINNVFSGLGVINIAGSTNRTITFAAGTLSGLTGTAIGTGTGANIVPTSGLTLQSTSNTTTCTVTAPDVPATISYYVGPSATAATATFKYNGTLASPGLRRLWIGAYATTALSTSTLSIEANQPNLADAPLNIDLGILKDNDAGGTATFTLGGTHAGDNTVSGPISATAGTLAITKAQTGRWVLSGTNTYTGATTISGGTLAGNSTSAFGINTGTTSVITQTGGTLEFGAVVNKGTNGVTLNSVGGVDAVSSPTGTTGLTCAGVSLSAASTIFNIAAGTFTLTNSAAMSGTGFGLTKTGAGEMVIASTIANNFTGAVTVSAGTLTIIGSAAPSVAGPLGNAASGVALTGTMKYAGTGSATISRSLTFTGAAPALEAAGTTSAAPVTFSAFTHAAGARTLTLKGDNTGNNTFSAVLNDNGASAVSLTKSGVGKWILSSQPTYTGLTTVSAGELQFNELNLSTNLTVNGTGKLSNTVLNGSSKTITCDGGTPEIEATTSANTVSGTTSVTAGTLRLTTEVLASSKPVTVLGTTNTTVSSGAAIRTSTGTNQRGQMRYGGNLTFNGGTLYIGG